jgi:hypothetical protein
MNQNNPLENPVFLEITPQERMDELKEKFNDLDADTHYCESCKVSPTGICESHNNRLIMLKKEEEMLKALTDKPEAKIVTNETPKVEEWECPRCREGYNPNCSTHGCVNNKD